MKHADVIAKLSLREKCALLSGATVFETHALPNKGVPAIWLSDGPNGLRKQAGPADHLGLNPSEPATCFPTAATVANSWDPALGEEIGKALGEETASYSVNVILGPGLNTKRSPLCWLAWAVLHTLLKRSSCGGTPDLNLLFQYNMPIRALAQMTGGAVGQETVDGIVMEARGFWIIGLVRAIIGFAQNAACNRRYRARLDALQTGSAQKS